MKQLRRFFAVGFIVFLTNNALFAVAFLLTGDSAIALLTAYALGCIFSYAAQSKLTFETAGLRSATSMLRFVSVNLVSLVTNALFLDIASSYLVGLEIILFQVLCSIFISVMSFLLLKLWVFKSHK